MAETEIVNLEWKAGNQLTGSEVKMIRHSHKEKLVAETRCGLREPARMYGTIGMNEIYKYEWAFAPTRCGKLRRLIAQRKLHAAQQ